MRKLASIQKIVNIEPIKGADFIEKATILGWECVVKKGQFKIGDLCIYIETDSILPRAYWNEFLFKSDDNKKDIRLKTCRLKNQISQGLVLPVTILPNSVDIKVGIEVTNTLGITKYEPYIPAQLAGQVKGTFPSFIPKTDETRIQAEPQVLERHKDKAFYVTEKLDGSSMTVYLYNNEFGVCSRRMDLKETENNAFWKAARELKIEERMRECGYEGYALQGELHGMGIQKNKYQMPDVQFRVFNVYNIQSGEYLDLLGMLSFCNTLGLETVPILETDIRLNHTVADLVEISKGVSALNGKVKREGLVWRPLIEERDKDLGRLSFKIINPEFLLQHKE